MRRADPGPRRRFAVMPRPILSRAALEDHLRGGGLVMRTMPQGSDDFATWIDPATNRTVGRLAAEWAIANGLMRGRGDGLFGDNDSQTYEAASWAT